LSPKEKHVQHNFLHFLLLLCNVGLLIVDHIHFQYNGLLFGILLLSCGKMFQGKFIQSALLFAVLLNMKHIFLYIAPIYFVYLLKHYCFGDIKRFILNTAKLGIVVITVTAISFGPFIDHLPQVMSRLFPFKRGLTHAYWAPNFWALYNFADKIMTILMKIPFNTKSTSSSGLVQEVEHFVLPTISPGITFIIFLLAILPVCVKVLLTSRSSVKSFMKPLIICAATSFMFGWHVHEKAILMVLIPLQILTFHEKSEAGSALFVTIFGSYSLLPLLFTPELVLVKLSLFTTYIGFNIIAFKTLYDDVKILKFHEKFYLYFIVLLPLYEHLIQYPLELHVKMPFMPLMLTSVYCAIGMSYFWIKFYIEFMFDKNEVVKNKQKSK
jgi:alpha-1,3-glucosyltransferase